MQREHRVWYIALIATFYLILCSFNVIYLATRFWAPGTIYTARNLFPVAGAVAGWLYLFDPRAGRKALVGLTVIVLLAIGESDPAATFFHITVLALLLLPSLKRLSVGAFILSRTR